MPPRDPPRYTILTNELLDTIQHGSVTYTYRDIETEGFLSRMARPLLVLEDADHMPETTYAVLRFFDPWLRPGEYIVVEDGLLVDQGLSEHYRGGPLVAIDRFLAERGSDYEIDRSYCDHYGRNVTWNVNGYIRKRAKPNVVVQSVTFKMIR